MKVALVTGANTGIGFAIAHRLLDDGFALGYATQDDGDEYKQPLEELRTKGKVAWVFGDLSDPATPAKLVDGVVSELGQLDVLVNNAGLSTAKPFFDLSAGDFPFLRTSRRLRRTS